MGGVLEAQTPQVACTAVWPRPRSGQRPPRLSVPPFSPTGLPRPASLSCRAGAFQPLLTAFPASVHLGSRPSPAALTSLELFMYLHAGYVRRALRVTRGLCCPRPGGLHQLPRALAGVPSARTGPCSGRPACSRPPCAPFLPLPSPGNQRANSARPKGSPTPPPAWITMLLGPRKRDRVRVLLRGQRGVLRQKQEARLGGSPRSRC